MRPAAASNLVFGGLVAGLASVCGCGDGSPITPVAGGSGSGGLAGNAVGAGGGGSAGATDGAAAGASGGTDGGGLEVSSDADTVDSADGANGGDITEVVPTEGCGQDPGLIPGMTFAFTIATSGTKAASCADSKCGPWMYTREFFITLPVGYDETKAYPLVFQGPGCGGTGQDVYPLTFNNPMAATNPPNVNNTVIRVGLTPPPNDIGHATNPGQGCFDWAEGDDSVDWVFYEDLYDELAGQLCFDKNRVFVIGSLSGGGQFADELGCKYAGDATHPIRGMMANTGGLTTNPKFAPTCTTKPMAGMWISETNDPEAPFAGNEVAIARAMKVDGCTIGTGFDDASFEDFPIGGGNPDTTCKRIQGCPDLTPLVVCLIGGNNHASHDQIANPGFSTFITLFENSPLLPQ